MSVILGGLNCEERPRMGEGRTERLPRWFELVLSSEVFFTSGTCSSSLASPSAACLPSTGCILPTEHPCQGYNYSSVRACGCEEAPSPAKESGSRVKVEGWLGSCGMATK